MLGKQKFNDDMYNAKVVYVMQGVIVIMPLRNKATEIKFLNNAKPVNQMENLLHPELLI